MKVLLDILVMQMFLLTSIDLWGLALKSELQNGTVLPQMQEMAEISQAER